MENFNMESMQSILKVFSYQKIELMFENLKRDSMDLNKIQEHGSQDLKII